MKTFAAEKGTKGTVVVVGRNGLIWEQFPATVTYYWPGTANRRPALIVQLDGVAPDHKTFTRNVLGRELCFNLNQKRRWISSGSYLNGSDKSGGMHFSPGPQIYEEPPF